SLLLLKYPGLFAPMDLEWVHQHTGKFFVNRLYHAVLPRYWTGHSKMESRPWCNSPDADELGLLLWVRPRQPVTRLWYSAELVDTGHTTNRVGRASLS